MGHLESMYCDVVEPSLHNGDRRGIGPVSIGAAVRLWRVLCAVCTCDASQGQCLLFYLVSVPIDVSREHVTSHMEHVIL